MRIAYLITAYDNPKHLKRLIIKLNNKNVDFYIHIDKKSEYRFSYPKYKNIYVLRNNLEVYWGSITFVKAVIKLIEKSFENGGYDFYVLLSGTDYPVRNNKYIYSFLKRNNTSQFINLTKMPGNNKSFDRVNYYYISTYEKNLKPRNFIIRLFNLTLRTLNIKRRYIKEYNYLVLYGGSTWWALTGKCIKYIIEYINNNPKLLKFYENTLIPEEMLFHTIIGNSKFINNVKNSFTYADWPSQNLAHPVHITEKHIPILASTSITTTDGKAEILFARKFLDTSETVIKRINKLLM